MSARVPEPSVEPHPLSDASPRIGPVTTWLRPAAALLLMGAGLAHLRYHAPYTLDDAYISFRYARNLARGMGLVYNPGEFVKGYSNTLYTLLMAIPEYFGKDPIGLSKLIGTLAFCVVCCLGYRAHATAETPTERDNGCWFIALCALVTPIAIHFMSGLETGLHTALIFAAVLRRVHEQDVDARPWSALLFVAVVWSRPEGILFFGAMAAHDIAFRIVRKRRLSRQDVGWYALPLLGYAGELLISQAYYGDALPQTYRAKTREMTDVAKLVAKAISQFRGESYLSGGFGELGWALPVLVLVPLALIPRAGRRRNSAFILACAAQFAFIVGADTDATPAFRFGVPALPFVFILMLAGIRAAASVAHSFERTAAFAISAGLVAIAVPASVHASRYYQERRFVDAAALLAEGDQLRTLAPPGATLASFDIGGHGYAAGGFDILDTAGLVTREVVRCPRVRCEGYMALVRPELIRRHPGEALAGKPTFTKDNFAARGAQRAQPYLKLDGGRVLVRRDTVLNDQAPAWLATNEPTPIGRGPRVVAYAGPAAVRRRQETPVVLYWKRGEDSPEPVRARRLQWSQAGRVLPAGASAALWSRADKMSEWQSGEVFSDFALLRTPDTLGLHALQVVTGASTSTIATVDVLHDAAASHGAASLLEQAKRSQAQNPDSLSTIDLLASAAKLDPRAATSSYHSKVARYAKRARSQAEHLLAEQRNEDALRLLQTTKTTLHAAYWQSGQTSRALRSEIDANARLRRQLVRAALRSLKPE